MAKTGRPIDDYIAAAPQEARPALEKLRRAIKAVAPEAAETISYGIAVFKLDRPLVGLAAFKDHCAFYLMSTAVLEAHAAELRKYELGKGSIRFPANKPLPDALVKKLVRARLAENEALKQAHAHKRGK